MVSLKGYPSYVYTTVNGKGVSMQKPRCPKKEDFRLNKRWIEEGPKFEATLGSYCSIELPRDTLFGLLEAAQRGEVVSLCIEEVDRPSSSFNTEEYAINVSIASASGHGRYIDDGVDEAAYQDAKETYEQEKLRFIELCDHDKNLKQEQEKELYTRLHEKYGR